MLPARTRVGALERASRKFLTRSVGGPFTRAMAASSSTQQLSQAGLAGTCFMNKQETAPSKRPLVTMSYTSESSSCRCIVSRQAKEAPTPTMSTHLSAYDGYEVQIQGL